MSAATMSLAQLKKSRSGRKTAIVKLIQKLAKNILDNLKDDVEADLTLLISKEMELIPVLERLESLSDPDDVEAEIAESSSITDDIIYMKVRANRYLASKNTAPSAAATFSNVSKANIRLPKLQIRRFDGTVQDWTRFFDQFTASVDSSASISKVEKFNYLKSFLSAEVEKTIQGLSLTEANYDIAFDLLKAKYGKKEVLVDSHINSLLKIAPVQYSKNGQDLRRLVEEIKLHIRSLEALGSPVTTTGHFLCPIILRALPPRILSEWHRKPASKGNTDVDTLLDFVNSELENIEQVFRIASEKSSVQDSKHVQTKKGEYFKSENTKLGSASALVTTQKKYKEGPSTKPTFCMFCNNEAHFTSTCDKIISNKDRLRALNRYNRCTNCFSKTHAADSCNYPISCRSCNRQHHTLLCPDRVTRQETVPKEVTKALVTASSCHASVSSNNTLSVLQSLRVFVKTNNELHQVVMMVDGGSERSFITKQTVKRLGLPTSTVEKISVNSFGGNCNSQMTCRVPLTLVGTNQVLLQVEAYQVDNICSGVLLYEASRIENFLQSRRSQPWMHLMGTGELVSIDVLIGADYMWRILTGHMKKLTSYLMATESIFGWLLQGSTQAYNQTTTMVSMLAISETSTIEALDSKLSSFWELDRSGTMAKENESELLLEDVEVLARFQETTTFINSRYQVEIPWNQNKPELCDNFALTKERLKRLIFSLQKDPEKLQRYKDGIYEYLKNGHTEEVTGEVEAGNPVYYMPHHPIIKEDRKTTKLRIVFDASSHGFQGLSLNKCQFAGPNLNPSIMDLLLRFRWHKVAITSDVEKAFLQIELKPKERDATRFLWTDEIWTKEREPILKFFRMTRVLFGMKSSPFLLAAAIRFHIQSHPDSNEEIRTLIDQNTYVDDFLGGSSSTEKSLAISREANSLMEKGGMLLKKWATNDEELRQQWQKDGVVSSEEPIELLKVLGLMWDPVKDTLFLKTSSVLKAAEEDNATKRIILEILARVFDPLGFVSPKTVTIKILLQDLWRLKLKWDEKIPASLLSSWTQWKEDLKLLEQVRIPRWYGTIDGFDKNLQLHLFCDATPKAYGTVAYLRVRQDDCHFVSLITSKSRVAPLELTSIPRLELLACLIGARLAFNIKKAWNKPDITTWMWSDSKVALEWINGTPSRWKLFVARRVQEIQQLTSLESWHYCTSKSNPADFISRGQSLKKLLENSVWWHGPEWLVLHQEDWPTFLENTESGVDNLVQAEENSIVVNVSVAAESILDYGRFGSWIKLIRVTCWIRRFIDNARGIKSFGQDFLSVKELQAAETYWFLVIQKESFPQEHRRLYEERQIDAKSKLLKFNPYLDSDNLIRMSGRLRFAQLNDAQAHPIILQSHKLVELFIRDKHIRTLHGGVQETLIKVRNTAWILRGRQVVRKAIHGCMMCRKWNSKPPSVIEAPLPAARVQQSLPFCVTGLDFAGPVWIKGFQGNVKGYICLFTCAVTRAIHLELVLSQGIKAFLLAFRRFIARRGLCKIIYSDNAKTFQQADRILREAWENLYSSEVQNQASHEGIEWRFIAPQAAWWGGFYERMVGSVKRHLRRTLGSALLDSEEFGTLLAEVESVVNNRPLVPMSEDPQDAEYISPSHFLLGRIGSTLSDVFPMLSAASSKNNLQRRWNFRRLLMGNFWRKWSQEYLLQLRSAHTLNVPGNEVLVKLDDVVLVKDERLPRGQWKIARVAELTTGRDGRIRSVMLQTSNGNFLRRAIQRICPLEVV